MEDESGSGEVAETPVELLQTAMSWVEPQDFERVLESLRDLRDTKYPKSVFKL